MKKIYAIYGTVDLIDLPMWLKGFREKYDKPYDFHITLKQMAYIDVSELSRIKSSFEEILKMTPFPQKRMRLEFNRVELSEHDTDDDRGYIYVFADQRNRLLDASQKLIREKLSDFSNYYFKDSRTYELDFNPHLTIARSLNARMFTQAVSELPKQITLIGEVTSIVVSCVKDLSLEETRKPENFITYSL